ncbi:MAG: hypothetical protein AMDU4_FER2C00018G0006 [Ferroplasma sp. Type II]|jgi:hypothetical protein|uniref:hypothetical protein n=1 Tax=Acidiplasma sp. TaxID=1872114 RepID=UPI0003895243|nr:hypothetical protein [Acidiplasma sp.]EQB74242.1 MAG: hypothetical protein AMDU4_FER2C00018G0006 [Ferroplasma sp. Type II]
MKNKIIIIIIAIAIAVIVIAGIEFAGVQKFNFGNNSAFAVEIEDPSFNLSHMNTSKLKIFLNHGLTNYSIKNNLINMNFHNSGNNSGLVLYGLISMYNSLNYSIKLNFTGTAFNSSDILYGYFFSNFHDEELGGNTSYYCVHDTQYPNGTIITTNTSSPPQLKGNGDSYYLGTGLPIFKNETISIPPHEIIRISISYLSHLQISCDISNTTTIPYIVSENISI